MFKLKYNCSVSVNEDDHTVFGRDFQNFLNNVGKDNFRKDDNSVYHKMKKTEVMMNFGYAYPEWKELVNERGFIRNNG